MKKIKRSYLTIICFSLLFITVMNLSAQQDRGLAIQSVVGPGVAFGKQWAVFIAIDRYQEWDVLQNPVRDAREIRDILRENYYIDEFRELYDRDATLNGIRQLFANLRTQVGINDSVFVFYAGHGHLDEFNTGYWIPVDGQHYSRGATNWLPNTTVRNMLDLLPAKHVFLISDSCFSGDILNLSRGAGPVIDSNRYRNAYSQTSRQVMTSGSSESVSDDSEFAIRLKSALRRAEGACIDPEDLFYTGGIRNLTNSRQQPLLGIIRGSEHQEGGSFLFFRRQTAAVVQPPPVPAPSVSSTGGSIIISSDIAGEILIDGRAIGRTIKEEGTESIVGVSTGRTTVAVREPNGTIVQVEVTVRQGQTVEAAIERPVPEGLVYEIVGGNSVRITKYNGSAASVVIPGRIQGLPVMTIVSSAFSGCSSLTGISIPSSVTSIGDSAFYNCSSLTSVSIPPSVTSIGNYAFDSCDSLTSIAVDSHNTTYTSIDGVLFDKNARILVAFPNGRSGAYTVPSTVTTIGRDSFRSNVSLTSVIISSSVTIIGYEAFEYCSNLANVTISSSVTTIESWAFNGCRSLTSVTIPSSVTNIGGYAFWGCSSLTSVSIPSSVTSIGNGVFNYCSSLTSITVDSRNTAYTNRDGILFDKNMQTIIAYPAGKTGTSYTIPSSVTTIGYFAFSSCTSLASISIPSSVTSISGSAFSGCSSLTSVSIPSSVTSIGDSAFYNCSSLTSVTLSRRTQVGEGAFPETARITYRD